MNLIDRRRFLGDIIAVGVAAGLPLPIGLDKVINPTSALFDGSRDFLVSGDPDPYTFMISFWIRLKDKGDGKKTASIEYVK